MILIIKEDALFFPNPAGLDANLRLPPTGPKTNLIVNGDDYGSKWRNKRAAPSFAL